MQTTIFNNGQPMYTPNLKDLAGCGTLTEFEKQNCLAEIELIGTYNDWHKNPVNQEHYAELAMLYATVYDQQVAASSLLLSFQAAVTKMEVERKSYVAKRGEDEKTNDLLKRNQLFMHVHQFTSAQLEKNKQAMLIAKAATEKLGWYASENKKLKQRLENIEKAETF